MQTIRLLIRHFKRWNSWRKHNLNSPMHKLLVLLGIAHSPTFALQLTEEEWEEKCEELYNAFMKGLHNETD